MRKDFSDTLGCSEDKCIFALTGRGGQELSMLVEQGGFEPPASTLRL